MSNPGSDDSGVFRVPSSDATDAAIQLPKPATPAPTPQKSAPDAPKNDPAGATPADSAVAPKHPDDERLTLPGGAAPGEVRVPRFDPPKPAQAPPDRGPPRDVRVSVPQTMQRGDAPRRPERDAVIPQGTPAGGAGPPSDVRVSLPGVTHDVPLESWQRTVRVSARKLEFPQFCPCCGLAADASYEARFVRRKGVRVVREETFTWSFPYCSPCVQHVKSARWLRTGPGIAAAVMLIVAIVAGLLLRAWGPGLMAGAALAVVAWVTFRPIVQRRVEPDAWASGLLTGSACTVVLLIALGVAIWMGTWFAVSAVGGAMAFAAWYLTRRWLRRMALREVRSTCACLGPAVEYSEYYGTEHEFRFASESYADAFARENAKKVV